MKIKHRKLTPQYAVERLSGLAYKVTYQTRADVFADFSGHVKWLEIRIYKHGWRVSKTLSFMFRIEFEEKM